MKGFAFAVERPGFMEKASEDRACLKARKALRRQRWEYDGRRCRCCGRSLRLHDAHIHEEPPRGNGGDPLSMRDTVTLCPKCHDGVTIHRIGGPTIRIVLHEPENGTLGRMSFEQ